MNCPENPEDITLEHAEECEKCDQRYLDALFS